MAVRNSGDSVDGVSLFKPPLMRPPQPRRMSTRVASTKEILDEEKYTQDLENIIERDFFPDLNKMRAHIEYREALETNDLTKLRELRLKLGSRLDSSSSHSIRFGGVGGGAGAADKSPATFETPIVTADGIVAPVTPISVAAATHSMANDDVEGTPHPSDPLSTTAAQLASECSDKRVANRGLDSYLASNTSEDNASFASIMDEASRKHRLKYAWLYNKESEHDNYRQESLALPSTEEQATDRHRVAMLDTWTYTNKNYVMYVPDGAELTAAERQSLVINRSQVMHANTRFRWLPFNEQANREAICAAALLQARSKEGKIGVDGKELAPPDEPHVNGYGFVVTPSPAPGVNESPLMTWGEIEGTPFRLDGGGGGGQSPAPISGPSFHIAAVPNRDRLAKKLVDKVGMQHREKKRIALQAVKATLASPSPLTSHVERLASMSPAVQRLASSQLRINLGDKSLRLSYTPSRTPRPSSGVADTEFAKTPDATALGSSTSASALSLSASSSRQPNATPTGAEVVSKRTRTCPRSATPSSLTDDLLNLPKRARAGDFFG